MHEEGVWSLASDDTFQVIYSGGRDKKVYATELRSPSVPYSKKLKSECGRKFSKSPGILKELEFSL